MTDKNPMPIFWTILLLTTIFYALGLFCFFIGLFFPNKKKGESTPFVSVIVAAKNEEKNIANLLADLTNQTYPKDQYEVIIVDDQSTDNTNQVIRGFSRKESDIKWFQQKDLKSSLSSKKCAMNLGIQKSRGEIILTTDADCRIKSTWIKTMVSFFTPETGMVIGFSQLDVKGEKLTWIQRIQALDFLSLLSAAQGSSNLGFPLAATGQNLAYRRQAFEEAGGFKSVGHRISGDDVLLLQLIQKRTKWKIRFAASEKSFNTSPPESTLRDMINQRTRWASNGIYQWTLNKRFFLVVLNTYLCNFLILIGIPMAILNGWWNHILAALALKVISEGLLFLKGSLIYKRQDLLSCFPIWFLFQIPYVIVVGFLGTLGIFTWKDTTYRQNLGSHS